MYQRALGDMAGKLGSDMRLHDLNPSIQGVSMLSAPEKSANSHNGYMDEPFSLKSFMAASSTLTTMLKLRGARSEERC
jgi:hypothetical protein